jgi:hypothetical protein
MPVHAVGAGSQGCQRVRHGQAAIRMSVPVHADLLPGWLDHLVQHEPDQRLRAAGRGVAYRIANDNGGSTAVNSCRVKTLDGLGIAAGGVFGYVHHLQPQRPGKSHGALGGAQEKIVSPVFRVTADRAGAEKAGDIDLYSCSL